MADMQVPVWFRRETCDYAGDFPGIKVIVDLVFDEIPGFFFKTVHNSSSQTVKKDYYTKK